MLGAGGPTGEFNVSSVTGGYMFEVGKTSPVRFGIGGRASVSFVPSKLEPFYGSRTPAVFAVYVRLAPQRMSSAHNME